MGRFTFSSLFQTQLEKVALAWHSRLCTSRGMRLILELEMQTNNLTMLLGPPSIGVESLKHMETRDPIQDAIKQ